MQNWSTMGNKTQTHWSANFKTNEGEMAMPAGDIAMPADSNNSKTPCLFYLFNIYIYIVERQNLKKIA